MEFGQEMSLVELISKSIALRRFGWFGFLWFGGIVVGPTKSFYDLVNYGFIFLLSE